VWPYGTFTLREDRQRHDLHRRRRRFGAAVGSTQYMDAKDIDRKVTFYYGARTAKDSSTWTRCRKSALTNFRSVPAL